MFFKIHSIRKKLKSIRLLVLDVDGVLTDGQIYIDSKGDEIKKFNVKDGLGIKLLQESNIEIALVSGGSPKSAIHRANRLKIKNCFFDVKDKKNIVSKLIKIMKLENHQVLYVGDDLNDLCVKNIVGIFATPKDAIKIVKNQADLVLSKNGGDGAIREIAEILLKDKQNYKKILIDGWINKN